MGIVGIGYWSSEPCGYWVLDFRDLWVLGIAVNTTKVSHSEYRGNSSAGSSSLGKGLPVPLAENSASVKSKLLSAEIVGRVCESGLSQLRRYLPRVAPRKLTATDSHRYRDYPRLSRLHRASLPVLPKGTASLVENHVCGESDCLL